VARPHRVGAALAAAAALLARASLLGAHDPCGVLLVRLAIAAITRWTRRFRPADALFPEHTLPELTLGFARV